MGTYMCVCGRTQTHTQHPTAHTFTMVDLLFWLKFLQMRRQSSTDFCSTKFPLPSTRPHTHTHTHIHIHVHTHTFFDSHTHTHTHTPYYIPHIHV